MHEEKQNTGWQEEFFSYKKLFFCQKTLVDSPINYYYLQKNACHKIIKYFQTKFNLIRYM